MNIARYMMLAVAVLVVPARTAGAGCPIPGFTDAAFAKTSFSASGTIDSWNSASGPYSAGTACSDSTSCSDTNSCSADIGTNASSFANSPHVSGSCNANANVSLPIPTAPAIPVANQLGAIGSQTITGPGVFSATSISESGNGAVNFKTASPNGPVVVYVSGNITFSGNGALDNDSLLPSNVLIMCTGAAGQSVTLNGNGNAYFTLYCPQADITLNGGGSGGAIWGAIVGNTINGNGSHALTIHYDQQVANMTTSAITCAVAEVSRATPIVAAINAQDAIVQGSYEYPFPTKTTVTVAGDVASFVFPYATGHVRARTAASISTSASGFASGTVLFDAATAIPAVTMAGCAASQFSGTCRTVFTTTSASGTGTTRNPPLVFVQDSNADAIGGLIAPSLAHAQWLTLTERLLAGAPNGAGGFVARLGAVDRSTVAVIGTSTYAGGARPTIVYFGATDGMLHAVCGSVDAAHSCAVLGRELWAFIPRVQLPLVRSNTTRIDGSPRVTDMFGDFTGSGTKSFRTILTFQTGSGDPTTAGRTPAVYALDITNPQSPTVAWEYTVPAARGTFELGVGETLGAGAILTAPVSKPVVYAETNNGGTGSAGVVLTAINAETGAQQFKVGYAYPAPRVAADQSVPATGIPGGAVGIDKAGQGFVTDVVFADLYGNLWEVDPATGASRTGVAALTTPLFSFSTDYHAIGAVPAIYSDGSTQFAVVASGGYADPADTNWGSVAQYIVSVRLTPSGATPPFTQASGPPNVPIAITLGAGEKAFAQATIVGTQLFLTTDSADVNAAAYAGTAGNSGHVYGYNMATGISSSTVVVANGASSVVNDGTSLYSSSGSQQQQLGAGALSTTGPKTDSQSIARMARQLWLRTQ